MRRANIDTRLAWVNYLFDRRSEVIPWGGLSLLICESAKKCLSICASPRLKTLNAQGKRGAFKKKNAGYRGVPPYSFHHDKPGLATRAISSTTDRSRRGFRKSSKHNVLEFSFLGLVLEQLAPVKRQGDPAVERSESLLLSM